MERPGRCPRYDGAHVLLLLALAGLRVCESHGWDLEVIRQRVNLPLINRLVQAAKDRTVDDIVIVRPCWPPNETDVRLRVGCSGLCRAPKGECQSRDDQSSA
jgi:hypothetical protein